MKSSDPIELSGLCDRVYVMSRGTIVEEIPGDELDETRIVEAIVRGPGMSKAARSPLGVAMPSSQRSPAVSQRSPAAQAGAPASLLQRSPATQAGTPASSAGAPDAYSLEPHNEDRS